MRDPDRIPEVLEKLGRLWKLDPDLRLGQIVMKLSADANNSAFFIEDDRILGCIEARLKKMEEEYEYRVVKPGSYKCKHDLGYCQSVLRFALNKGETGVYIERRKIGDWEKFNV